MKYKPDKSKYSYKSQNYLQTDIILDLQTDSNTHIISCLMSNFHPMTMNLHQSYYFMILHTLEFGEMLKLSSQKNSNKGSPTQFVCVYGLYGVDITPGKQFYVTGRCNRGNSEPRSILCEIFSPFPPLILHFAPTSKHYKKGRS